MKIIYFMFSIFITFHIVRGDSNDWICKDLISTSSVLQLRRYLFCDYDPSVRPIQNHKNKTFVEFLIVPQFIEADSFANIINIHTFTVVTWNDNHLTWDPSRFGDIKSIFVEDYEIWRPDITVHNEEGSNEDIHFTNCWVSHNGTVICRPAAVYTARCTVDHVWWPYDIQNCTVQFGSWSHSSDEMEFIPLHNRLIMTQYQENYEWKMEHAYVTENIVSFKFNSDLTSHAISYHFILRRFQNISYAVYGVSLVALMVMTLTGLWLDPQSTERMVIVNLNFICHYFCIQGIPWHMPSNGIKVPNLLIFFEGSLILASMTLILTNILRRLQEINRDAPVWMSTSSSFVLKSKFGQILLLSILDPKASASIETEADDNTNLIHSNKNQLTWKHVAIIIGWIAFFCTFLVQ